MSSRHNSGYGRHIHPHSFSGHHPVKPKAPHIKTLEAYLKQGVLIQPEIIKVNSIPEAQASPPYTRFRKWDEKGVQGWQVSEQDYIDRRLATEKARYQSNISYYQEVIENINNPKFLEEHNLNIGPRSKQKKVEEYQFFITSWKKDLERLDTPEGRVNLDHRHKTTYIESVKAAIKHGDPVPDEVVEQRPEFQVARDARRRYEKGLHTSFANKSAAVNAVMFLEKGYKVKRQDGKEILKEQISEIDAGIKEIQTATGPSKDIMQKSDLTIAHTSGTYPFLGSAGGLYHPAEKTITMGILGIRALAHEWGHWLDHEAGKETRKGYEFYTNGKTSRQIKAFREGLSKEEEYSNPLFQKAEHNMNNTWAIRELEKAHRAGKDLPPDQKEIARTMSARIGKYWRDPREIFARLTEQYVAEYHGKTTEAAESPEYYRKHPAYWRKETFEELKPLVKTEIERRISITRGT